MADLLPAKAGDVVAVQAIRALEKLGMRGVPEVVGAKTPCDRGQWLCVDCGYPCQNNIDAWNHAEQHKKHRFAWRNFDSGNLEEP